MTFGKATLSSLKWIGRALKRAVKSKLVRRKVQKVVIDALSQVDSLEDYLKFIKRMEENQGAKTAFWAKMKRIARTGTPEEVDGMEAKYAVVFKDGWDKFVKPNLKRIGL